MPAADAPVKQARRLSWITSLQNPLGSILDHFSLLQKPPVPERIGTAELTRLREIRLKKKIQQANEKRHRQVLRTPPPPS